MISDIFLYVFAFISELGFSLTALSVIVLTAFWLQCVMERFSSQALFGVWICLSLHFHFFP